MGRGFHITRLFADESGESHFEDLVVELDDGGPIGFTSDVVPSGGIIFRENDAGYEYDWHCAPRRQFVVLLDAITEIEVSDGEVRRFQAGEVLLLEDTDGRGHRTRSLGNTKRRTLFLVA